MNLKDNYLDVFLSIFFPILIESYVPVQQKWKNILKTLESESAQIYYQCHRTFLALF